MFHELFVLYARFVRSVVYLRYRIIKMLHYSINLDGQFKDEILDSFNSKPNMKLIEIIKH